MSADHYRTLDEPLELRHKVERSEFLGIAFSVRSEDDFQAALRDIEKRHFDATHHCWAYRLFGDGDTRQRSSDAGEPSGTAGKPILMAIEGADLHDAAVVVVRWFGGVKLGTGGLSRAYRDTAAATLRNARLADRYVYERIRVVVPFAALSTAYRLIDPPAVILAAERFGETNEFEFDVRRSLADEFRHTLAEKRLAIPPRP
ncbi:MAG TPA: YigZ family protein [Thermoanaerobaculia bacterium]|nr:YigZ family protein [Thermoanaerobaculia bacterium]